VCQAANSSFTLINRPDQQIIYFEISKDDDLKDALKLLKDNLPANKEIVLILAGHGDKDWLFWNTGNPDCKLDPSDYEDKNFMVLFHDLPLKLVIFDSCSSGKGGAGKPNQVNRLAEHIRKDIGGSVIGPQFDVGGMVCTFDPQNNITDVKYTTDLASGSLVYTDAAYRAPGQYKP
jgi:hypothetical protein